jgi:hypothetical protein
MSWAHHYPPEGMLTVGPLGFSSSGKTLYLGAAAAGTPPS